MVQSELAHIKEIYSSFSWVGPWMFLTRDHPSVDNKW